MDGILVYTFIFIVFIIASWFTLIERMIMRNIIFLVIVLMITPFFLTVKGQELTNDEKAVITEADQIAKDVANLLGAKITRDFKKGFKSKDELIIVLEKMFAKEYPPEKADKDEKLLKFLGFLPENVNLLDSMKALLLEQIGGFYDPETKELYLIRAGQIPILDNQIMRKTIMAHEICHAIQDMSLDLNSMMNEEKIENDDEVSAFQAFIEGQATIVMMQYLFKISPDKLPDLGSMRQYMADSGDMMGMSFNEFKNASLYIKEKIALFPYVDGAVFYRNLLLKYPDKKPVEFFQMLPKSSEQILHFDKYIINDQPSIIKMESPETLFGQSWKILSKEKIGEIEWKILASEHGLKNESEKIGNGWDGTSVYLYENGKNLAMILISTWDSEKDAEEAYDGYQKILKKKYPASKNIKGSFNFGLIDKGSVSCIIKNGADLLIFERIPEDLLPKVLKAAISIQRIN
jgi:hypothetical protein